MLADDGDAISDVGVLRHEADVPGRVASQPTIWWALEEFTSAGWVGSMPPCPGSSASLVAADSNPPAAELAG